MNAKWTALMICVLTVNLLISGCGLGQPFGPTYTPVPTLTPTNTSTPVPPTITPTPPNTSTPEPIGEVQTPQGVAIITSTERASGWPVNCDPKANFGGANACFIVANSGYEILIVNIVPKDPIVEKIDVDLDANIYVSTEDGQQYKLGSAGFSGEAQMVMFSVPIGAMGLTLHWEDNTPISLP